MESKESSVIRRDTSAKRKTILDAAVQVFVEEGYETASMDRVAERAGASKRTVYNHFASKEDLLQAVIDQFGQQMHTLKQIHYDPARPLEEQLGDFADAELAVVNNPVWLGFIKMLLPVFLRSPELAQSAMTRHGVAEDGLTAWMRAAALDEKLSAEDPVLAARVFSAMLGGAFTWPAVSQGGLEASALLRLKKELIDTFLCRYGK